MNKENNNQTVKDEKNNPKSQTDKISKYEQAFKEILSVYDSDLTDIQALRKIRKIVIEQLENTNIKEWYVNSYPTDELGCELNANATFNDLSVTLNNCKDVYKLLDVSDSIVRERVFEKLSQIKNVDYDQIYNQWLKS